jgi:hypothetical protein
MLAGPMMACGAPFLLGGGLALTYDVAMWHSFRDVAAAAMARGRHRLQRNGVQTPPPHNPPADTDDDPPTIATPKVALDDTVPLSPRYDPVEHVHARRQIAANMDAPRGLAPWEAVHDQLQCPPRNGWGSDPLPSASHHLTKAPPPSPWRPSEFGSGTVP